MEKHFIIAEKISTENMMDWGQTYWNNETGFGDYQSAEVFTEEEKETMYLPVGGYWVEKE